MNRARLPNRRASTTFEMEHEGQRFHCSYSRYDNGDLAEIFLNSDKANSSTDVAVRDGAIAISFALQYGAKIKDISVSLCRQSDGTASGPLAAALDLIAKEDGR